jgi:hypothetical protein
MDFRAGVSRHRRRPGPSSYAAAQISPGAFPRRLGALLGLIEPVSEPCPRRRNALSYSRCARFGEPYPEVAGTRTGVLDYFAPDHRAPTSRSGPCGRAVTTALGTARKRVDTRCRWTGRSRSRWGCSTTRSSSPAASDPKTVDLARNGAVVRCSDRCSEAG